MQMQEKLEVHFKVKREREQNLIKSRLVGQKLIKLRVIFIKFLCLLTELSSFYRKFEYQIFDIYRENHFEFLYDCGHLSSISNFDTIFDINTILYEFRYVQKFRFDMHVLSIRGLQLLIFLNRIETDSIKTIYKNMQLNFD